VTPTAVLFDLDGVLIDSRVAITRSINHGLAAVGAPTRPTAELQPWIGPPLLHTFTTEVGPARAHAALEAYRERYATASLEETELAPGFPALLAAIADVVPVAVATSKPRAFAVPLCERLGLARHLTAIEGPDLDAREETKAVTVARALAALGLAHGADAVLVGDRRHDVEGARANGIRCVGVLWGIGDRAELAAAGADAIVADPAALPGALGLPLASQAPPSEPLPLDEGGFRPA
jgi:phosphoglycolate phosphatase